MKPSVSIIVPTYNRAQGLPKIVDAILRQSYWDFELIVVNDGSKDNTEEVLNRLKLIDSRIRIVNKPNGGVSSARNVGIEKAIGEFLIFVDDDDTVGQDYIKNLMDVDRRVDLVIDSYSNQTDDGPILPTDFPEIKEEGFVNILKTLFDTMQKYRYCLFPVAKRYNLSILKNNNVKFRKDITLGEDRPFILDYLRFANSIRIINSHSYIVKEITTSDYRLSKGIKPADFLLRNFKDSYSYLINYGEEYGNQLILKYADNYLAEKCIDYLLIPMACGRHSNESEKLIRKYVPELWQKIKVRNVKNRRDRIIVRMVRGLGVLYAVMTIKLAFKLRSK